MKKQKRGKVKAVVFDVGGVLQLDSYSVSQMKKAHDGVHEYMAKKLKIPIDTWFDSIDTTYAKSIEGEISKKKAVSIISKNLGIKVKEFEALFCKAYKIYFRKNKELYNLAYKLKEKGMKIGILSDQWYLSDDALISKEDRKRFDVVIISCEVGLRKPNIKIYELLIKEFKKKKIKAQEILFVDNRKWNLTCLRKLKIQTVLFKDNKQAILEINKKIGKK